MSSSLALAQVPFLLFAPQDPPGDRFGKRSHPKIPPGPLFVHHAPLPQQFSPGALMFCWLGFVKSKASPAQSFQSVHPQSIPGPFFHQAPLCNRFLAPCLGKQQPSFAAIFAPIFLRFCSIRATRPRFVIALVALLVAAFFVFFLSLPNFCSRKPAAFRAQKETVGENNISAAHEHSFDAGRCKTRKQQHRPKPRYFLPKRFSFVAALLYLFGRLSVFLCLMSCAPAFFMYTHGSSGRI